MAIFKKRRKPQTRIVKHEEERPPSQLAEAVTGGVNQKRNWKIRRDEFRSFDSPPGRF